MKKIAILFTSLLFGVSACLAGETILPAATATESYAALQNVNFPKGYFYTPNNDFVIVKDTWVRIVFQGAGMQELSIVNSEYDPYDNYLLRLSNGESITISSDRRNLYYKGVTFSVR